MYKTESEARLLRDPVSGNVPSNVCPSRTCWCTDGQMNLTHPLSRCSSSHYGVLSRNCWRSGVDRSVTVSIVNQSSARHPVNRHGPERLAALTSSSLAAMPSFIRYKVPYDVALSSPTPSPVHCVKSLRRDTLINVTLMTRSPVFDLAVALGVAAHQSSSA
jgi:hypothetical protein